MRYQLIVLGLSSVVMGVGCAAAQTQPVNVAAAGCNQIDNPSAVAATYLKSDQLYGAQEVRERVFLARAIQPKRTVGADLYVHATPNVSGEYLERVLTCHAAQGQGIDGNDPFHPTSGHVASIEVRPVSSGYAVRVLGSDHHTSKEIWQRAKTLTAPGTVTIEQVAATSSDSSSF